MITYRLTMNGTHAIEIHDGVETFNIRNVETDPVYLAWIEAGNTPEEEKGKKK